MSKHCSYCLIICELNSFSTFSQQYGVLLILKRNPAAATIASGKPPYLSKICFPILSSSGGKCLAWRATSVLRLVKIIWLLFLSSGKDLLTPFQVFALHISSMITRYPLPFSNLYNFSDKHASLHWWTSSVMVDMQHRIWSSISLTWWSLDTVTQIRI